MRVNNKTVSVLLDTGAECNTLPKHIAKDLQLKLTSCNQTLHSYSGHEIKPTGKSEAHVTIQGQQRKLEFLIVPNGHKAVIGGQDCLKLGLVKRVNTVSTGKSTVNLKDYSDVFGGIGCIE
jgi:predicted aspartyl protease